MMRPQDLTRRVLPGLVHYASFPGSDLFRPSLERVLATPDFAVIELSTLMPAGEVVWVRSAAAAAGKRLYLAGASQLGKMSTTLSSLESSLRAEAIVTCRRMVDLAYEVGAVSLMLASGPDPGPERRADGMKALAESLAAVCAYARESHPTTPLTITIEPFDRETDRRRLLGPTAEAHQLWRKLRGEGQHNFAITPDLSHLAQLGEEAATSLALFGADLDHLHVATCVLVPGHPLFGDQHPPFDTPDLAVSLYDAAAAVRSVVAARDRTGRREPLVVSIEVKPGAMGRDPFAELDRSRADLERILAAALNTEAEPA